MNYARIYSEFIENRKQRAVSGCSELHHIVPKSLGGSDNESNLIKLSPADHYFAHLLLAKIHGGKMWAALWATAGLGFSRERREAFARRRMVAVARQKMASDMSDRRRGVPNFKVRGANNGMNQIGVRNKHAEAVSSEKYKNKLSIAQKDLWNCEDEREKRRAGMRASWSDPDVKARRASTYLSENFKSSQSEKISEIWENSEYRATHKSAMQRPDVIAKMRDPKHKETKAQAGRLRAAAAKHFGFAYHALPKGKVAEYRQIIQGVSA